MFSHLLILKSPRVKIWNSSNKKYSENVTIIQFFVDEKLHGKVGVPLWRHQNVVFGVLRSVFRNVLMLWVIRKNKNDYSVNRQPNVFILFNTIFKFQFF